MLNNILLSQTIGNCSERRNKTRGKGIGYLNGVAMPVNELLI